MGTILASMLQRLYAGILRGPSIYARPGRQRIDWLDLKHFAGTAPENALTALLGETRRIEFPARVKECETAPDGERTPEQKAARDDYRRQTELLQRLRDIAADARDFQNDHGESALFVGFPLLWLPRADLLKGTSGKEARVLAPLAFVPVSLEVRRGGRPGAALSCLGEGADLVLPNPALGAWIEQMTGQSTEGLFADRDAADPWREIAEIIAWVRTALDLPAAQLGDFGPETALTALKEVKELPTEPALLPSALLGLFPMANLGLLRDTRWMMENEGQLAGPVRTFLQPAALEVTTSDPSLPAEQPQIVEATPTRNFANETLVTQADPCQAAAVAHARVSDALVIHGPPGTGKSQTIANIIGDHLARGERVLFVCDKRTAIDVVKYRLDALGLGKLCGVVHDPARDRTALYRQLRDDLENLADTAPEADQSRELESVNSRLTSLHGELTAAYSALNRSSDDAASFHERTGEWLELLAAAPPAADEPTAQVSLAEVRQHQADLDEVWRRAARVDWVASPWRDRLGISTADFLAKSPTEWEQALQNLVTLAHAADEFVDDALAPLDGTIPLGEQAAARRELATLLEKLAKPELQKLCAHLAQASDEEAAALERERDALTASVTEIETAALDSELRAAVQDAVPPVAELNTRLQAIETYLPLADSFKRFFAFSAKAAATSALAPLGLPVSPDNLAKARSLYRGVRARAIVSRFLHTWVEEGGSTAFLDDARLRTYWHALTDALTVIRLTRQPALTSVSEPTRAALQDQAQIPELVANLRTSADRADRLAVFEDAVTSSSLFSTVALREFSSRWRAHAPCAADAEASQAASATLEDAVRLTEGLSRLPPALATHARWHATNRTEPGLAFTAVSRWACETELRARALQDRALQSIDTERVEAAFRTLADLAAQKQQLIRAQTRRHWQTRQRARLLAATGSRLNGAGAALKQRLVTRGERALKLRQMLATGAATPDGDPLFDLCPVWMTSPATVAQVFPREALFDVVIFDEASQCRLEEALPVLLRARRVVVAGDPKQLPPTRFFESGPADSSDTDAETAEELFEQQQSEVEDLLGAALNLNLQEAFLDVHYRSRDEALIGFSNEQFYGTRLQPIPGHPKNKALQAPLRIHREEGIYEGRANRKEAEKAVALVEELLNESQPPSIGIACFNLPQRDLINELLDTRAEVEPAFATRLAAARERRGRDSFEGLFVKNLENVQGDERDVMIICTTFAPDAKGKFRRNFGALSGSGGGRRLNVLVTRARTAIHLITSIPRSEYASLPPVEPGRIPNGRFFLYSYLRYAEWLEGEFERWQSRLENLRVDPQAESRVLPSTTPSRLAQALGSSLRERHALSSIVHWGNDGFCVDAAIVHPMLPADVTVGVLTDFNRFAKTPDPVEWELFRSAVLQSQGWKLHRVWSPALLRNLPRELSGIVAAHEAELNRERAKPTETTPAA